MLTCLRRATLQAYAGKSSPSSGFVGAYLLLQLCQEVSVFGVGLGGCKGDNCRGGSSWHYWQEDTFKLSREFMVRGSSLSRGSTLDSPPYSDSFDASETNRDPGGT